METFRVDLLVIALVAALAPLVAELPTRFRMPVVVLEILLGILVGPHIFNWVAPEGLVAILGELGLTFLLFMVGMEIDLSALRGKTLTTAATGWGLSFGVALVAMLIFQAIGLIITPPVLAAVALSTTALGVIAPILRDRGELDTDFGKQVMTAATMGEFGPLIVISLLVVPAHGFGLSAVFMLVFVATALLAAYAAIEMRSSKWIDLLAHTMQSSGQLPVRICIVFQALLIALAAKLGMSVVMGAYAAGLVVGLVSKGEGGAMLRQKLDAIGYGFLIPIFFIVAGMRFDVSALWASPIVIVQLIGLLVLLLVVRGVPVLLYKDTLAEKDRLPFAFYSATGLPLIVIITEIGVSSGLMPQSRATVLVCAAMISVFLFPILAEKIRAGQNPSREG